MSSTSLEQRQEELKSGPEILSARLGWFGKLDTAIYHVEVVVIVFALIAMSVAVFLDVVAQFVVRSAAQFSGAGDASASSDLIAVAVTILFVAMMAFAAAGQAMRRTAGDGDDAPARVNIGVQLAITAAVVAGCVALGWGILHWSSATIYRLLVGAVVFLAATHFIKAGAWPRLGILMAVSLPGLWFLGSLPTGYSWAQSYGLFLLLWVGFLGASVAARERRHLRVDLTRKLLPPRWLPHFNALSYFVAALFTAMVFYLGFVYLFGIDSSYMRPIWEAPSWLPQGLQEELKVYPLPDDASMPRRIMQVVFAPSHSGDIPDWLKVAAIPVSMLLIMIRFLGHSVVFAKMAIRREEFSEQGGLH
jgi:TRAP-type C4-dicarboxylate transport system permease small subunit